MDALNRLNPPEEQLSALCREFHVQELSVFGSVLRSDFDEQSDVDFLVVFDPGFRTGLFHLLRFQHRLEDLIGRKVDMVPKGGLKPLIRDDVLRSARVIYAA